VGAKCALSSGAYCNNGMSITAKQLSKNVSQGKEIDTAVREHLQIIDDMLQRAGRVWGRNIVMHEMPTDFAFVGLEKRTAQLIVYTAIIKSLQDRGFQVHVLLEPDRTLYFVEWVTELDTEQIEAMSSMVRKVQIMPADLDSFLERKKPAAESKKPASKQ
jgi:hypothetical protein